MWWKLQTNSTNIRYVTATLRRHAQQSSLLTAVRNGDATSIKKVCSRYNGTNYTITIYGTAVYAAVYGYYLQFKKYPI